MPVAGESGVTHCLPNTAEVLKGIVERAKTVASRGPSHRYQYNLRAKTEELDAANQAVNTVEKLYRMELLSGYAIPQLLRIQGKKLSRSELDKATRQEQELQKTVMSVDAKKMAARGESWITQELVDRFTYSIRGRTVYQGRPTLVMDFRPKASTPEKNLSDRIFNRVGGTVCVDEASGEPARLLLRVVEPLSLGWFGWIGSLTRCEIRLDRVRMPDDVWINAKQTTEITGRRLLSPLRLRITEESSSFQALPELGKIDAPIAN